ncbi:MAG TPA: hypothetical protein VMM13_03565, partial [Euzebya sp.]|nr:hypothetical protein [Euzebya sp.]
MRPPRRLTAAAAGFSTLSLLAVGLYAVTTLAASTVECPPGTVPVSLQEPTLAPPDQQHTLPAMYRGPGEVEFPGDCRPARVESFQELATRNAQQDARTTAPFAHAPEGARYAAATQRQAMLAQGAAVRGSDGTASQYGQGPIHFDEGPAPSANGIIDSTGRIDDFFYDQAHGRLFAAIGTSGVWLSEDLGESWTSIGDGLPTNIASAVSWTPNGGPDGTVVVLTGEHTFGGASFTGLGAFWSTDLGATWTRAEGAPDGTLGFAIEVDPTDPDVVYAATGRGLWRSADAGRTYVDVELPVGTCHGDYNTYTCKVVAPCCLWTPPAWRHRLTAASSCRTEPVTSTWPASSVAPPP